MAQLKNTTISDTGFLQLPSGTTGQRPTAAAGQMRFNTTTGKVEQYNAALAAWVGTPATGVVATGGDSVYDVNVDGTTYRVHVFTSAGTSTFSVAQGGEVEYLIVAGGGGGGQNAGAGGGAGGYISSVIGEMSGGGVTAEPLFTVTPQNYAIIVGAGGAGGTTSSTSTFAQDGGNSSAFGFTAIGGGGGANSGGADGRSGGSGGGTGDAGSGNRDGGPGTAGQGFKGGDGTVPGGAARTGGGGGGAGALGQRSVSSSLAGAGGAGVLTKITGISCFYAGGGGGAVHGGTDASGGLGGGGNGSSTLSVKTATPNTGGGGGAGRSPTPGGRGGDGIVVVRYPVQQENPVIANEPVNNADLILDLDFAKSTVYTGSGSAVTDSRLNGLTGTLSNGTSSTSTLTHRAALTFDGSDDRMDTNLRKPFNEVLTVECWYRGTKTARNHLWNFLGNNLHCNFNDGPFPLWMYWNGSGSNRVRYNGNFTDGTIKHLVFTHSGSTNKVFLNGVELPIAESGGTQTFSNIGAGGFNVGDTAFGGDMYVLKVYERALTATEILNNFNVSRWRFGV